MKTIGIPAQWFLGWNGGIDFLNNIIQGLIQDNQNKYLILIPQKELPPKNIAYKGLRFLLRALPFYFKKDLAAEEHFSAFKQHLALVHYRRNLLKTVIKTHSIDLLLPCARPPLVNKQYPWVGYLPDCQHRYLSDLFTLKEIEQRNHDYQAMVDTQKTILVNSVNAKNDLIKFFAAKPDQIHSLPFCPTVNEDWLNNNAHLKAAYSLPDRYFMISNQFWKHKGHASAFDALALLNKPDIHIVCSGKMDDYRDSDYINALLEKVNQLGIKQQIHFLGFIPKLDQIEILKSSLAMIQPTLFEGGPGGGCVYDAISLGVPCILSDIEINKEVRGENVLYFSAGQASSLAETMIEFLSLGTERPTEFALHDMHQKNLAVRASSLSQLISKTLA